MIGGTVVDMWRLEQDCISVVVKDTGLLCVRLDKEDNSLAISRGDSLWWQGDVALWTPKDRSLVDVRIARRGCSFEVDSVVCPERDAIDQTRPDMLQ